MIKAIHSAYSLGLLSKNGQERIQCITGMTPAMATIDAGNFNDRLSSHLAQKNVDNLQSISLHREVL